MNSAPVGGSAAGAPNPSDKPESCPDPTQPVQISLFGDLWKPFLWGEVRLLMIVVLAGAFGSLVHSLRSFYWYVGNRDLKWSWAVMYLLQPFSGGILAMLFYFVIRGGFFSPQSTVDETSPFAFAAFSGLVGMFSPQAVEKLKQIAGTIFAPDQPGKDHLGPSPKIVSVTPASGPKSGNTTITITGTNFTSGAKVSIGGKPVEPTSVNSTTITAATPGTDNAGLVDVEVTNPDGQKTALSGGFNYT